MNEPENKNNSTEEIGWLIERAKVNEMVDISEHSLYYESFKIDIDMNDGLFCWTIYKKEPAISRYIYPMRSSNVVASFSSFKAAQKNMLKWWGLDPNNFLAE